MSDSTAPTRAGGVDPCENIPATFTVGSVNSVDTYDGIVALAVEHETLNADSRVACYQASGDSSSEAVAL